MEVKTIDVNAKEWFDKANGNSYFSGTITLNFGLDREDNDIEYKRFDMPFQYGYGDHYVDMANQQLIKEGIFNVKRHENGSYGHLRIYCEENDIILRTNIQTGCKKREL